MRVVRAMTRTRGGLASHTRRAKPTRSRAQGTGKADGVAAPSNDERVGGRQNELLILLRKPRIGGTLYLHRADRLLCSTGSRCSGCNCGPERDP